MTKYRMWYCFNCFNTAEYFRLFVVRQEDAVLKALIKRDHKGRMAVKQKFKETYDLVGVKTNHTI